MNPPDPRESPTPPPRRPSPPPPPPAEDSTGAPPAAGIDLAPGIRLPAAAVQLAFSRSGGPGGQNVNKLSTRAELRVPVDALAAALPPAAMTRLLGIARGRITRDGVLQLFSQEFRSQEANRQTVFDKLRGLVALALTAPKPRRPTKVSRSAKRRRVDDKKRRGQIKSLRRSPPE